MPRRRTVNLNLPTGMRARTWSSGKTYNYLEAAGKTTPLGEFNQPGHGTYDKNNCANAKCNPDQLRH